MKIEHAHLDAFFFYGGAGLTISAKQVWGKGEQVQQHQDALMVSQTECKRVAPEQTNLLQYHEKNM